MVIGITGGIAVGKSNVTSIIKSLGYHVIDADEISRFESKKGGAIYDKIVDAFGKDFLDENLEIDRKKLGMLIFNDENKRKLLNSITHPIITLKIKDEISKLNGIIFVDIPLLYEAGLDYLCDYVICCYCKYEENIKRLCQRDNISYDYAVTKIKSQMDLNLKCKKANYIIDTSYDFDNTRKSVINTINKIKEIM